MRATCYKVLLFIVGFVFIQGCILPWVISNNVLPVWADIAILGALVFLWVFLIDKLVSNAIRKFNHDTNKDASDL